MVGHHSRHARHLMGAARRGRALDTAEAVLHTPGTPGHTIGLLSRPEVTSTFCVGKANPSEPGIENRRNLDDSTGRRPLGGRPRRPKLSQVAEKSGESLGDRVSSW